MELPRKRLYKIYSKLEGNDYTYYVLTVNIIKYLITARSKTDRTINEIINSGYYDYEELFPDESDLEKLKNLTRMFTNTDENCINERKPRSQYMDKKLRKEYKKQKYWESKQLDQ